MTVPQILMSEPVGAADKPLLVLGHSLGSGPATWDLAAPALEKHFRVARITIPGHAGAPIPTEPFTVAEIADAVAAETRKIAGGERAYYAGVSIGGAIALELGVAHAETFAAVATIASGAELGGEERWLPRSASIRAEGTSPSAPTTEQNWFTAEFREREPETVRWVMDMVLATDREGFAACGDALGKYDVRAQLPAITIPVLALYGDEDPTGTEERQDEIVNAVPHGRKALVTGTAHQPQVEKPAEVARALVEFFGGA